GAVLVAALSPRGRPQGAPLQNGAAQSARSILKGVAKRITTASPWLPAPDVLRSRRRTSPQRAATNERAGMIRLPANLGYLFTERPLIERIAAAAAAGFRAVELQLPYDHPPSEVKAALARHSLTVLGVNTPPSAAGEAGFAAVPGREREFVMLFARALDYVTAIGGCQVHCLAGTVPPHQR